MTAAPIDHWQGVLASFRHSRSLAIDAGRNLSTVRGHFQHQGDTLAEQKISTAQRNLADVVQGLSELTAMISEDIEHAG